MKTYGKPDPDTAAYDLLTQVVKDMDVQYIVLNPRMPVDARPCKLPLSLTIHALLVSGDWVTVRQDAPGLPARRIA